MNLAYRALVVPILAGLLISCNKKKDDDATKSVAELVKGKAYSGDIKYTSEWTSQPFYVEFNPNDNLFLWREAKGIYGGTYSIDEVKREFKVLFDGTLSTFTATIGKDGKISSITYPSSYGWSLQNVELNSSVTDPIENTKWKGTEVFQSGQAPDPNCTIGFLTGLGITFNTAPAFTYIRNGASIKATLTVGPVIFNFFMVINKNKLKGIRGAPGISYPLTSFDLAKQ